MNEELTNVSGEEMSETETDYVAAINALKANSVSKDKYDKLRDENKKLLNSLINNTPIEQQVKEKPDIKALREKFFSTVKKGCTNLDFTKAALELREALIENGEADPFLPVGSRIVPSNEDIEGANRFASTLQSCIDYADGNPEIFLNEVQRVTVDTTPMLNSRKYR